MLKLPKAPLHHLCTLALITILLTGCTPEPTLDLLPPGSTILAFGDSLTFGTGTSPEHSYPSVLSTLSGHPVVNAGIPGEVTEAGLERLPSLLREHQPALVVLCHGGNDILRRLSEQAATNHLIDMIRLIRNEGAQVVLVGVPDFSLFGAAATFYDDVVEATGVVYMPDRLAELIRDSRYKSDPVHLNAEGYRQLAASVHNTLVNRGALLD